MSSSLNSLSSFLGAAIVSIWGIAHVAIPTRSIVESFGPISMQNKRILVMEWLMEGVLLVFIGVLVALVTWLAPQVGQTEVIVYRTAAATLVVMAGISLFTGARTTILPMKLCPVIFLTSATLIFVPTV